MTQDINTTEARELFEKTTQGDYYVVFTDDKKSMNAVYVGTVDRGSSHDNQKGMDGRRGGEIVAATLVQHPIDIGHESDRWDENAEWIAYAHNNWQAMLDTIDRQRAELGEYWRAACAIESVDDVVSAKGLADLHAIRTGNNYSQVGPSVAEMLVRQRDELAKEVERLQPELNAVSALLDTEISKACEARRKVFKQVESGDSHDCNLYLADGVIEGLESALRLIKARESKGGA